MCGCPRCDLGLGSALWGWVNPVVGVICFVLDWLVFDGFLGCAGGSHLHCGQYAVVRFCGCFALLGEIVCVCGLGCCTRCGCRLCG